LRVVFLKSHVSHCFISQFLFWCGLIPALVIAQSLPAEVANLLRQAQLPAESIGIMVAPVAAPAARVRETSGAIDWQSQRPMQPASTIKVLTSIAALELLGPAYTGSTVLLSRAPVAQSGSSVIGDVVLRGRGSADFGRAALVQLLGELKLTGVRSIEGDLLLDRNWFEPARPDLLAVPFDETPEFRYNVVPDALSLDFNLVGLRFDSDAEQVKVTIDPPIESIAIVNQLVLNSLPCANWEDQWRTPTVGSAPENIVLTGAFPKNCTATTQINVLDRTVYAENLFRTLWQNMGGSWTGRAREVSAAQLQGLGPLKEIAKHDSRPLSELVRDINKRSDNQVTRLVYAALGATGERTLETQEAADQQIIWWLRSKKIDPTHLVMDNGSGLSRSARISPAQMASVLQAAHASRWAPEFLASLPVVAVDGSMRNRLKNTPAAAQARIKTGGLRNVVSAAGYVIDKRGQQWVIVAIINQEPVAGGYSLSKGRQLIDGIIAWVADRR
jgi:serine-type D-Ala-D-Ala carboxypeptidase/endopeptidase (penicillin-binding protein 4)